MEGDVSMSDHETGPADPSPLPWLGWARQIQALAQTGHFYAQNDFDRGRAEQLLTIAADIVAAHSRLSPVEVLTAFTAQPGYVTPKVDVRGVVFRQDEVLMVREVLDGGWTFPGGWADVGETPRQATEREVYEEAGLRVRAVRLIGVYDANRVEEALSIFHAYKLVFQCEPVAGELTTSSETSEVAFFPIVSLPEPLSAYRTTARHITDALAAYRDSSRPTVFD